MVFLVGLTPPLRPPPPPRSLRSLRFSLFPVSSDPRGGHCRVWGPVSVPAAVMISLRGGAVLFPRSGSGRQRVVLATPPRGEGRYTSGASRAMVLRALSAHPDLAASVGREHPAPKPFAASVTLRPTCPRPHPRASGDTRQPVRPTPADSCASCHSWCLLSVLSALCVWLSPRPPPRNRRPRQTAHSGGGQSVRGRFRGKAPSRRSVLPGARGWVRMTVDCGPGLGLLCRRLMPKAGARRPRPPIPTARSDDHDAAVLHQPRGREVPHSGARGVRRRVRPAVQDRRRAARHGARDRGGGGRRLRRRGHGRRGGRFGRARRQAGQVRDRDAAPEHAQLLERSSCSTAARRR